MNLKQLLESKKTHDACSDEIDTYHADTMEALRNLKDALGPDVSIETQQKYLKVAMTNLRKAMSLATNWDRRCG